MIFFLVETIVNVSNIGALSVEEEATDPEDQDEMRLIVEMLFSHSAFLPIIASPNNSLKVTQSLSLKSVNHNLSQSKTYFHSCSS